MPVKLESFSQSVVAGVVVVGASRIPYGSGTMEMSWNASVVSQFMEKSQNFEVKLCGTLAN